MFIICLLLIIITRRLSFIFDLVDKPNQRKLHTHHVPLVGGIAIYFSVLLLNFLTEGQFSHMNAYLVSSGLLIAVGILDDRFDLPVLPRICVQAVAALIIMVDGVYLRSLGLLWFGDELTLGFSGYIVTLIAVGASINIFNMVDGIDGLIAGLCSLSLGGLAVCFYLASQPEMMAFCLCLIAAIVPFMLLNLGFPFGVRQKIFMGDAGSTFLGFTVIWLVMLSCQGERTALAPANALWLLALPLIDMVAVAAGRIQNRQSPLRPDRTHFHHLLMAYGFSAHQTLFLMLALAFLYCAVGVGMELLRVNPMLSLLIFVGIFALHCYVRKRLKRSAHKYGIPGYAQHGQQLE